jgi:hypothetical protein
MASPEAHRSSAIGRSGHREGAPMARGDGGGSGEAHQGRISAVELVNRAGNEVIVTPRVSKPHDYANHMFMRL